MNDEIIKGSILDQQLSLYKIATAFEKVKFILYNCKNKCQMV